MALSFPRRLPASDGPRACERRWAPEVLRGPPREPRSAPSVSPSMSVGNVRAFAQRRQNEREATEPFGKARGSMPRCRPAPTDENGDEAHVKWDRASPPTRQNCPVSAAPPGPAAPQWASPPRDRGSPSNHAPVSLGPMRVFGDVLGCAPPVQPTGQGRACRPEALAQFTVTGPAPDATGVHGPAPPRGDRCRSPKQ